MAVYATVADMLERIGEPELIQLSDRTPPYTGAIVSETVQAALDDAAAEIDGFVQARYPLPLSPVPTLLIRIGCDLARKHLHRDRPTEAVKADADTARRQLQQIARGEISLQQASGSPAASDDARATGPARVFTADTLAGF